MTSLAYGASPEELAALTDQMVVDDSAVLPEDIPSMPGPDEPMFVNMSIRMPVEVVERLKALADQRGEKFTRVAREWIEVELADAETSPPVTRAEALKAISVLRKLGMVA